MQSSKTVQLRAFVLTRTRLGQAFLASTILINLASSERTSCGPANVAIAQMQLCWLHWPGAVGGRLAQGGACLSMAVHAGGPWWRSHM